MAQADYVVANGTGAAVRSDLNGQLAAIVSNNSGVTEPATMYAYQWWADTTTGLLKIRNAANNAWITLRELDGTLLMENGTAASPGLSFASDLDTGLFSAGTNAIGVATNGVERVEFGTSEVVFNDGGANCDFRIEGDTNTNLFFVDASADTVEINGDVTITDKIIHSGDTNTAIRFPAADTVSIETDGSERARIDSSGRLLVGTTSAQGTNALQIEQSSGGFISLRRAEAATAITDGEDLGAIEFQDNAGGVYARILGEADGTAGASDYPGRLVLATTADGASSPTERMRISSGAVYVNTTTNFPGAGNTATGLMIEAVATGCTLFSNRSDQPSLYAGRNSDGVAAYFTRGGINVGSISVTATTAAFNNLSDYRVKEHVVPITNAISRLQSLKPSRFNFVINPGQTVDGFIAHEAQDVVPEAVTGTKDAVDEDGNPVYQGIDQSKLVPLLTAALQEAIGEIESLKARVVALEP